jgi:hypothetical protein
MYYEINVSLNGQHYFATAERSITTEKQAEEMLEHFSDLFPAADGYQIKVTEWRNVGIEIFANG